jgi:hypothetical protein
MTGTSSQWLLPAVASRGLSPCSGDRGGLRPLPKGLAVSDSVIVYFSDHLVAAASMVAQ